MDNKTNNEMTLEQTMWIIERMLPIFDGMAVSIPLKRALHFLKAFPRPCNGEKYAEWDVLDYALKVSEEYGEMMEAILEYRHAQDCRFSQTSVLGGYGYYHGYRRPA